MARGDTCPPPLLWKCKGFCALIDTAERSVDELYMHYIHSLSSASGGFAHRGSIPGPRWGTFVPRPLICPPLKKKSCGRPWTPSSDLHPHFANPVYSQTTFFLFHIPLFSSFSHSNPFPSEIIKYRLGEVWASPWVKICLTEIFVRQSASAGSL